MPKLNQSIVETTIDKNGEIIETRTKRKFSWGDEPPFVKLYLQDILYLSDMPKHHEKILFELLKRATYADDEYGMTIVLSSGLKRIIAKNINIKKIHSIDNALSDLVKGKILFRVETGVYGFNPYFFGKGDWQDVARLRLEINYDEIKGRTFQAVCSFKKEEDET